MPLPHLRAGLGISLTLALLCPVTAAANTPAASTSGPAPQAITPATSPSAVVVPARRYGPLGIDVSNWQRAVNWRGLRAQGKRFAYIKATEGTTYRSPSFSSQYSSSYNAKFIRGAYHYANPGGQAGWQQANYFVDHGGGWSRDGRTLPGMLDLEQGRRSICYGLSQAGMISWITSFVNQYKKRTGRNAVIYTNYSWWVACTGNTTKFAKTNRLFLARWRSDPGGLPGGWKKWTFWQYSDTPIDQDMFNGSLKRLKRYAKGR
jgi:GH25 family lysozyme M1 (1,4-beta-N-acetylmuramidase)